jgi:hypothetical protein
MPRFLIRLETDLYVDWSTVVDAPVTPGMSYEELIDYIKETRGDDEMHRVL